MTNANPEVERILRARAQALARAAEQAQAQATMLEVLEFRLASERYAVETRHIQEVHPFRELTPLPCTPAFVLGVVNVRGRILPVLDIKRFFGLPEQGLTDLHRIILVHGQDLELGLLADVIVAVRKVKADDLQPTLATFTGIHAEYLRGIDTERLVVLDLDRILCDPKIIVHDEVVG
jgi:purine-binding chemotaxis protein CheW